MPELERVQPPYLQIAAALRAQILDGRLAPGDLVPSTRQLMEQWQVSKATATRALAVLADEGLTIGEAGRGTTVKMRSTTYRRARDRYALLKTTGSFHAPGEGSTITAAELTSDVPVDVRSALGLSDDEQAIRRHRVTRRDGEIVEVSTSWFAGSIADTAPALLSAERIASGTAAYVAEVTGRRLAHGTETSFARLATPEEAAELGQTEPLAVMVTEHLAADQHDEPLTYEVGVAPTGARVSYDYSL